MKNSSRESSFRKLLINIFFVTVPSLIILFFILELFFRYAIPAAQLPLCYFDPEDQILRYDENKLRDGFYTIGKFAQMRAHWHINNKGWNSDIDYSETRSKPLIAIIGDSYVEAMQVDVESIYPAILRKKAGNEYDVYSFGISGAALSQYLQMSRYVNKHFAPDIFVFNVVHNDFLESLCTFKPDPWWLCIDTKKSIPKESIVKPYCPSKMKRLLWHSSIIRYFVSNIQLKKFFLFNKKKKAYAANIDVDINKQNEEGIRLATDYILKKIREENDNKKIIFLIDAPRKNIYSHNLSESRVAWLNKLLAEKCRENGFYFIDMTDIFLPLYEAEQKRFESSVDFHWNERGHTTVADTLYRKLQEIGLLEAGGYPKIERR